MAKVKYRAEYYEDNGNYVGLCPDLGVTSHGNSPDDVLEALQGAVEGFLEGCKGDGILEAVLEESGFERCDDGWNPLKRVTEQRVAIFGFEERMKNESGYEARGNSEIRLSSGETTNVIELTEEDIKNRLRAFEKKYGISSQEFLIKYHTCGFEEENLELLEWASSCYMAGERILAELGSGK